MEAARPISDPTPEAMLLPDVKPEAWEAWFRKEHSKRSRGPCVLDVAPDRMTGHVLGNVDLLWDELSAALPQTVFETVKQICIEHGAIKVSLFCWQMTFFSGW
jgi:hypothetical protein